MLVCRNAEGIHGQEKVGNPCLIKTKIFVTVVSSASFIMYTCCVYIVFLKCCVTCMGV